MRVLGRSPVRLGEWVGRRAGDVAFAALGTHRRRALENLALAFPDRSPAERRRLARRSFQHLGVTFVELSAVLARPLDDILGRIALDGLEHLRTAMRAHGRVLVVTAHLGNWELLSAAHRLTGYPLAIVVRPLDAPWLNALAEELRLKTGAELIDKRRALRPVLAALGRGRLVAILLDQNASRREGAFVPFFGHPASTSRSIGVLAVRTASPVVPIFIRRERRGRHRVVIGEALVARDDLPADQAILDMTARCTAIIEAAVRETPEQWLWVHRRWRTCPLDGPRAGGGTADQGDGSAERGERGGI